VVSDFIFLLSSGVNAHVWVMHGNTAGAKVRYSPDEMFCDDFSDDFGEEFEDDVAHTRRSNEDLPLSSVGLVEGDRLVLDYDMGCTSSFEFVVASVEAAANGTQESRDLGVEEMPRDGTLLTPQEAAVGARFRVKYAKFLAGKNKWSWNKGQWVHPEAPRWGSTESLAIRLLLALGMSFGKAWTELLEPTLLNRANTATSGFWYKAKKECGWYKTKNDCDVGDGSHLETMQRVRRLLRQCREDVLMNRCTKIMPVLSASYDKIAFNYLCSWRQPAAVIEEAKAKWAQTSMLEKVRIYLTHNYTTTWTFLDDKMEKVCWQCKKDKCCCDT